MFRVEIAAVLPHLIAIFIVIYALSWLLYQVIEVPSKRLLRFVLAPAAKPAARMSGTVSVGLAPQPAKSAADD
jgi:peptidoglycan/LPS O-acetylase OafA/YrhL